MDVAVIDLGLLDGVGRELTVELRRRNPGISVLVLSAAMGSRDLDETVKAGADAMLDKEESPPTIAYEVRRLGGSPSASAKHDDHGCCLPRTPHRRSSKNSTSTHWCENRLGYSHFHGFGVAHQGPWVTRVNNLLEYVPSLRAGKI